MLTTRLNLGLSTITPCKTFCHNFRRMGASLCEKNPTALVHVMNLVTINDQYYASKLST